MHAFSSRDAASWRRAAPGAPTFKPPKAEGPGFMPRRPQGCACGGSCPRCQAKAASAAGVARSPLIGDDARASGQALDEGDRRFMESRFGQDFGGVRIHADAGANRSADAIGAKAYASGNQIVFGSGQYKPGSEAGRALLAHELVHTLQRRSSNGAATEALTMDSHPAEVEAHSVSRRVMSGRLSAPVRPSVGLNARSVSLQLDPRKVYCALHAAVCLGLSENPPAAALCWTNFAIRCGGGMASAEQPGGGGQAVASEGGGAAGPMAGEATA